jgi:hypothetical protein
MTFFFNDFNMRNIISKSFWTTVIYAGILDCFGRGYSRVYDDDTIEENCGTKIALSTCLKPKDELLEPERNNGESRYVAASVRYFLSMKSLQKGNHKIATESDQTINDYKRPLDKAEWNTVNKWFNKTTIHPRYATLVIRYEFPPWLLTTGYGAWTMRTTNEALRAYRTTYKRIDCRAFDTQPFGRCHVVFLYGTDDPNTPEDDRTECPIYEEFTFNDKGEITFIEAWTDHDGYLPMRPGDYWAQGPKVKRLSTKVPGLGRNDGKIKPHSDAMQHAADIFDADFEAPYWDMDSFGDGPFNIMVQDITGPLWFWPEWTQRAIEHRGEDVFNGCRPPEFH